MSSQKVSALMSHPPQTDGNNMEKDKPSRSGTPPVNSESYFAVRIWHP
jgi:hypothetical protein